MTRDEILDLDMKEEDVVVDGQRAVVMATFTGTDRGGFMGMLATGRVLTVDAFDAALKSATQLGGLYLTKWNAIAAIAGACWLLIARITTARGAAWNAVSYVCTSVAVGVLLLACSNPTGTPVDFRQAKPQPQQRTGE